MHAHPIRAIVLIMGLAMLVVGPAMNLPPRANAAPTMPTVTPTPASDQSPAQQALAFIAKREHIPLANLLVVHEVQRDALILSRSFQSVTLVNQQDGQFFTVLVDLHSGTFEDPAAIAKAEERALRTKYGKLQPALYDRIQTMQSTDVVQVMIWVTDRPGQSRAERERGANAVLAARYPQVQAALARGGKPMDVGDRALSQQIEKEYAALLDTEVNQSIQPLFKAVKGSGAKTSTSPGLPGIAATLTKQAILLFAQRSDVAMIALADKTARLLDLYSAVSTNQAPAVLTRGYDGTGAIVAVLEPDNVDFDDFDAGGLCSTGTHNCFRNPGAFITGTVGINDHATLVASAIASENLVYPGMAPGATILSAGVQSNGPGDYPQYINSFEWAVQNGTDIINASVGFCPDTSPGMDTIDWAFDYYARLRNKLVVVAAGNNDDGCPVEYVDSPAKGWNVLAVGSLNDAGDSTWANDTMAGDSVWSNPWINASHQGDREKPEVVAPGVNVVGVGVNGQLVLTENSGTSFAAPQVAGEAALMIHRNPDLRTWPEAMRAIIMATATHNIEGPTGIPSGQDYKDGAGGINADLADTTASSRGFAPSTSAAACTGPCWWGEPINNSTSFDSSGYRYYYFNAQAGDRIRAAISWWSDSNCSDLVNSCSFDKLSTDLNVGIMAPDGTFLPNAWSASYDNNYELVPPSGDRGANGGEIMLPQTGTYRIAVYKARFEEDSNYLGVAWTKLPPRAPARSIWDDATLPSIASDSNANMYELGTKFRSTTNGYITGIRFYKGSANTGTHIANLWSSTGALLASAMYTTETALGWQEVQFPQSVPITANTTYVASYHTDVGHFAFDNGYFANAGASNSPLWSLTNGIDGVNGVYKGGASGFPSDSYNASNYWIDVVFNTAAAPAPAPITRATIWPDTTTPSVASAANSQAYELGVRFRSNRAGYIKGIRFYKGAENTGTHIGNLWSSTGTLLSSATFTNETASGWHEVLFDTAVPISANTTYVASYHTDAGYFAFDYGYFTTSGPANPPLRALMNGEDGVNGVYKDGASGFPTSTYNASNYWADVVFSTNP